MGLNSSQSKWVLYHVWEAYLDQSNWIHILTQRGCLQGFHFLDGMCVVHLQTPGNQRNGLLMGINQANVIKTRLILLCHGQTFLWQVHIQSYQVSLKRKNKNLHIYGWRQWLYRLEAIGVPNENWYLMKETNAPSSWIFHSPIWNVGMRHCTNANWKQIRIRINRHQMMKGAWNRFILVGVSRTRKTWPQIGGY